jgi:hypothetical protein
MELALIEQKYNSLAIKQIKRQFLFTYPQIMLFNQQIAASYITVVHPS